MKKNVHRLDLGFQYGNGFFEKRSRIGDLGLDEGFGLPDRLSLDNGNILVSLGAATVVGELGLLPVDVAALGGLALDILEEVAGLDGGSTGRPCGRGDS